MFLVILFAMNGKYDREQKCANRKSYGSLKDAGFKWFIEYIKVGIYKPEQASNKLKVPKKTISVNWPN